MRGKLYRLVPALMLPVLLGGCLQTAGAIITAPVKLVAKTADWVTVSQDEADRNRGRKLRHAEEEQAKHERKMAKERRKAEREARRDR